MDLEPEIKKYIEEQSKVYKYDPDKDPVMINFRKRMKAIEYKPSERDVSGWEILIMMIFLVLLFLAL